MLNELEEASEKVGQADDDEDACCGEEIGVGVPGRGELWWRGDGGHRCLYGECRGRASEGEGSGC